MVRALFLDPQNNVFVTGSAVSSVNGNPACATAKWDGQGNFRWAIEVRQTTNYLTDGYGILVDQNGFVYVAGTVEDSVWNTHAQLIKLDPGGNLVWVKRYDADASNLFAAVATDGSNIYAAGYGWVHVSDRMVNGMLVVKYTPGGDTVWTRMLTTPAKNQSTALALACDHDNNVIVTGTIRESLGLYTAGYATLKYCRAATASGISNTTARPASPSRAQWCLTIPAISSSPATAAAQPPTPTGPPSNTPQPEKPPGSGATTRRFRAVTSWTRPPRLRSTPPDGSTSPAQPATPAAHSTPPPSAMTRAAMNSGSGPGSRGVPTAAPRWRSMIRAYSTRQQ